MYGLIIEELRINKSKKQHKIKEFQAILYKNLINTSLLSLYFVVDGKGRLLALNS
jgi:hypothetical protein